MHKLALRLKFILCYRSISCLGRTSWWNYLSRDDTWLCSNCKNNIRRLGSLCWHEMCYAFVHDRYLNWFLNTYADDLGEVAVDVNYLNVANAAPVDRIFICWKSFAQLFVFLLCDFTSFLRRTSMHHPHVRQSNDLLPWRLLCILHVYLIN